MTENRTILVTGGAGYVGAHACKALAARGYIVEAPAPPAP